MTLLHNCGSVAVKFRLPRHRGKSVAHIQTLGKVLDASMCQKGVTLNLVANPPKQSWIRLRKKPVLNCRHERMFETSWYEQMRRNKGLSRVMDSLMFLSLRRKAGTYVQRETDPWNGVTTASVLEKIEKVASRKPCNGGIVQEAKAFGNARDMQTWTRWYRGWSCE